MRLTVDHILSLPAVRKGDPEILTGASKLGTPVRWIHVAELRNLTGFLEGGELVLTTGLAFEDSSSAATRYLAELASLGAAGVIVEILDDRAEASRALREAAASARIPVILVRKPVRFVEITENVHKIILAGQLERVEKARHVHEVFTLLSLESAGADEIVARAAQLIGAPVVLENISHLVLAFDGGGIPAGKLLNDWENRSRVVHLNEATTRTGEENWLQTPVGLRSQRWGRLVVPVTLDNDTDASMVLERAGQALSINRFAERDQRELGYQARAGLMHELRQPRSLSEAEAQARAGALGLRSYQMYVPVVFRLDPRGGEGPLALQRRERALLESVNRSLQSLKYSALAASLQTGTVALLLGLPPKQAEEGAVTRICAELRRLAADSAEDLQWAAGIGHPQGSLLLTAAALDEANHVAEAASTLQKRGKPFYRAADIRLRGLLALLRSDPRVQTFVEGELAGILGGNESEELLLLEKYLEAQGNKAELARTSFLSRPTLYSRLARLERKLGLELDEPESRTSLHVALMLYRLKDL
ncbi:PucR family transcriptional regulator [Arthrobacter sp. H16F315]|uniref:PucR family transcriptional regulator n=1 Tax=Arthrobacter sp. H16F315 TaxID=2955314 RepID=UPI002096C174|nr:PucR family transcriptional regulator ligand-binding domain-containing protein [Arthrobacter sp. H16F315]MDD1476378.1 PucR family transcriptional regulator ligand-binding domain-containing protein [Arthrobacter sp. H16F315]